MIIDEDYKEYCNRFIEFSNYLGRPLTLEELDYGNYQNSLPKWGWFKEHNPNLKCYSDFIKTLIDKIHTNTRKKIKITKEDAIKIILETRLKLNRPLKTSDFKVKYTGDNVNISVIEKYWGNFGNMLKELNLERNKRFISQAKSRTIEELQNDIIKMCNIIKETENRDVIHFGDDISKFDWMQTGNTYRKRFKEELGITLYDFVKSIGFRTAKDAFIHVFDDGEMVRSKYEYDTSLFFRSNNIKYKKDVSYQNYIDDYNGHKTIDYVVNLNGDELLIEIAGLYEEDSHYEKGENYVVYLEEKIKMLEENNLNFKIIYQDEFLTKRIDEIFLFLLNN